MIAVQVLSQSGDVQLFQKESGGGSHIVPVTTISSGDLQALTQVKLSSQTLQLSCAGSVEHPV